MHADDHSDLKPEEMDEGVWALLVCAFILLVVFGGSAIVGAMLCSFSTSFKACMGL